MVTAGADDPFARLGLARSFEVSASAVEAAYLRRAAGLHPDLASSDVSARDEAERGMAAINTARATLLDDEKRANALLALLGGPDASACRDLPDGFLQAMMAKGMALEDAAEAGGEAAAAFEAELLAERAEVIEEARAMFASLAGGGAAEAGALRGVRLVLNRWRYLERLLDRLRTGSHGADVM